MIVVMVVVLVVVIEMIHSDGGDVADRPTQPICISEIYLLSWYL